MRMLIALVVALTISSVGYAEEYRGKFKWVGKAQEYSFVIVVEGKKAIDKSVLLDVDFEVVENSKDELLLMKRFTKKNSGKDYPVGMSLMVLDKKTGVFVRSNTFAGGYQNNHATGTGKLFVEKRK
ncbi:MAG: hypothetical protein JRJ87_26125 [Deltaproteobacteria bacterium]|nr:hypothetical protein [Deltaproteobacteria bacterium]